MQNNLIKEMRSFQLYPDHYLRVGANEIERLTAQLKETVSLKYHDDLMHQWKVSEVAKDKRIAELESALRGYVKATTGQESAIVTFPMALEGEVK